MLRIDRARGGLGDIDAPKPLGDAVDGLASAKARQHLFPQMRLYQGAKDLVGGALAQAQGLDFRTQGFFGLANGNFVDAVSVLCGFAARARLLAVALQDAKPR